MMSMETPDGLKNSSSSAFQIDFNCRRREATVESNNNNNNNNNWTQQ